MNVLSEIIAQKRLRVARAKELVGLHVLRDQAFAKRTSAKPHALRNRPIFTEASCRPRVAAAVRSFDSQIIVFTRAREAGCPAAQGKNPMPERAWRKISVEVNERC